MAKEIINIGLDIGSNTIKILGAFREGNNNLYRIKFFEEADSLGFFKGRVKDENDLVKAVKDLLERVKERYDVDVESVMVNISGDKLEVFNNSASVSVGSANEKVTELDKERVEEDVKNVALGNNKSILRVFPREWKLDNEKDIVDPLGLQGIRLELDASIMTCFSGDKEALEKVIKSTGIDIEDIVPTPFADATLLLDNSQKELGVALVNIGFGTTSLIVYEDGKLLDLIVFPVGSSNITNDIAVGLKTEIHIAEKIKKDFGITLPSSKKIEVKLDSGGKLVFSERELRNIVAPRVSEIFSDLINKRLKKIGKEGKLPAGIILTGGGAKLKGVEDFAKKEFKLPCKIGYPENFIGFDKKDPSYSTVCGLVLLGDDFEEDTPSSNKIKKWIKEFFSNFKP